jgi:Ca2+-binding EF-hand superfamily protein
MEPCILTLTATRAPFHSPLLSPAAIPSADEPKEIKILYKRFRRLDRTGRGTISGDDLTMIPEVAMNPLAARLVAMFERDAEDRVNFKSFAMGLAVYNEKGRPEPKARGAWCTE